MFAKTKSVYSKLILVFDNLEEGAEGEKGEDHPNYIRLMEN